MKGKLLFLIPLMMAFLVVGVLGATPVSNVMFPSDGAVYAVGNTSGIVYANGTVVTDTKDFVFNVSMHVNGTLNTTITASDSGYPADLNDTQINFTYTFANSEMIDVIIRTCLNSSVLNCTNASIGLESDQVAPTISAGTPATGYSGQTITLTSDDSASVCKFDIDGGKTFNSSRYDTTTGGSSPTIKNVQTFISSGSKDFLVFCRDDHQNRQDTVFKHSYTALDGDRRDVDADTGIINIPGSNVLKNIWNAIFGTWWFWG